MAVKRSRSGSRILAVLEAIANRQPVGVSDLARKMGDDKSAVQRAIMTLADAGWITPAPGKPTRWQLTAHILTVAHASHHNNNLLLRARSTLEDLRNETGETVLLSIPDCRRFIIVDVLESRQLLRTAPGVGLVIPARHSASGRAVLPFMDREHQFNLLGEAPDAAMLAAYAKTLELGYSVSSNEDGFSGSINIGAPVLEVDGRPVAAIVVSVPAERASASHRRKIGEQVLRSARSLSRGKPRLRVDSSG